MDPRRWHDIAELYQSASPLTPAERDEFLDKNCASDTVLRDELRSLLETEETAGEFLNKPVFDMGLKLFLDNGPTNEQQNPNNSGEFIGTVVGNRYEVVGLLDSGGVGDVYRARDMNVMGRDVVIKVLQDSSLSKPWIVAKFQQEIEALTKIDDAGVVGVIDAGKLSNGKPYLVMEFVEGFNLRKFMKQRQDAHACVEFSEIAEIVRQVGRTLTSAHDAGIIHRDLKPANIMVRRNASDDLQVKVIDFGIAKITKPGVPDTTTTGLVAGTFAYMAPEQLRDGKVTPCSDIYALGIIAYELITGNRLFNTDAPGLLVELHRAGVRVLPGDLRPGLPMPAQAALLKALAYEPADRYQRARDFGDALAHALTGKAAPGVRILPSAVLHRTFPVNPPAPGPVDPDNSNPTPLIPVPRKRRAAGFVLGTILLPLVVGLFYAWHSWSTTPARTLTYSLTVQKRGEQRPVQSTGEEKFKTGDRFRLNVFSREAGYLYVLNEGAEDGGGTVFTLIYPTPKTNQGSAKLEAPIIQTNWNTFAGPPDKEEFWIIWSASPIEQLEDAKNVAMNAVEGKISSAAVVRRVRDFLSKHTDPKLETVNDQTKQQVDLKGKRDPLVKLVELEYH